MSAGTELQVELVRRLQGEPRLKGIYDGPPAQAELPYAVIDAGSETDWSHKSGVGRELLVGLTIWANEPSLLSELADAVEALALGVESPEYWQLVSLHFVRRTVFRDPVGPWAVAIDFRARLLAR